MGQRDIKLTHSLSAELFRKIFGIYCIVALCIITFQAWSEYKHTRERVLENLMESQALVENGLASAVWHLDKRLLDGLIRGVLSQREVTGVAIYTDDGALYSLGGQVERGLDVIGLAERLEQSITAHSQPFRHLFPLFDPDGLSENPVGFAVLYSDKGVVLAQVQPLLISLLSAATVKTILLWSLFWYFGRKLLTKPIAELTAKIREMPLELSTDSDQQDTRSLNELQLFQQTFAGMHRKLEATLEELRGSNDKLANINLHLHRAVDQSPTITSVVSLKRRVIYSTPTLTALTHFEEDEIQSLFDKQIFHRFSLPELLAQSHDNPELNELWKGEVKLVTKDNRVVYLQTTLSTVRDDKGHVENLLFSGNDITALRKLALILKRKNLQQQEVISQLEEAKSQLVQSEKMASIGQMAAGIAHEINNPVGFVNSNLNTFRNYTEQLFTVIDAYERGTMELGVKLTEVQKHTDKIDLAYLREDLPELMTETQDGLVRIRKIVSDLMGFSRTGETELSRYDLHSGIESTLNVAWHELKYKVEVVKAFGEIPHVECVPSQINQVLMNMMVNAAHAIAERGVLTLSTGTKDQNVWVEIEDTGSGISPEHLNKLFDPFFTTKPVGQGTGLGLSVSYGIIAKHNGQIDVRSEVGKGTCFRITIPAVQPVESPLQQVKAVAEVN